MSLHLEQRYVTDVSFRRLVESIYTLACSAEASGTDLRDACLMAQYLLELRALRSMRTGSQVDTRGYRSRQRGFNSD